MQKANNGKCINLGYNYYKII